MTPSEHLHHAADEFLNDVVDRVDELGRAFGEFGGSPQDAQTVVAQAFLAVLFDLFEPNLAFAGAFVNVVASLAHATVVQHRAEAQDQPKAN